MAVHPLSKGEEDRPDLEYRRELRDGRVARRLVLSVVPCYGQSVPGEKEVDQMTIALASFRRATGLFV